MVEEAMIANQSTAGIGRHWRVFYAKPRSEKKVEERLVASGKDVFLPMRTAMRQWSDRKKKVSVPLFPGYIFAHVTERERLDVLEDDSIVRTLSFGGTLAAARQEEIDALKLLQTMPDRIEAVEKRAFPAGSEVIVINGPLNGLRGCVTGHPKAHYLLVEAPSVRQVVRVHVPADWVMRVVTSKSAVTENAA
jgi:transcription termination/antitermination protein NusG